MISAKQVFQFAAFGIVGAAYLALSHHVSVAEHPSTLAVVVGLLPLAGMALGAAWLARLRLAALLLWGAVVVALGLQLEFLRDHAVWLYFVQHAGAMTVLGLGFGGTLRSAHEDALCSRVARVIHAEPLSAAYVHYTWKVTLAWTLFFAISALLSVGLFFWGPIEAWSVFANLLTPVLIGLMFAVEYLVRLRLLPEYSNVSIAAIIRAYRNRDAQHQPKDR